jgi:hypothetical protein
MIKFISNLILSLVISLALSGVSFSQGGQRPTPPPKGKETVKEKDKKPAERPKEGEKKKPD